MAFFKKSFLLAFCFLLMGYFFSGCGVTKVSRVERKKVIDLSGRWNDTDARLVSEELVRDCLTRDWLTDFIKESGAEPVVIVGNVLNRTSEHIDYRVFTSALERELLNSGKVRLVASPERRWELREEREDQPGNVSPGTISPAGHETGADFMLQGNMNSLKDEVKGKQVVFYQITLELIDLTTDEKVWIGQKEIKKTVVRSPYRL